MVLESIASSLLSKYLGDYIEGSAPSPLPLLLLSVRVLRYPSCTVSHGVVCVSVCVCVCV